VTFVLPSSVTVARDYLADDGESPFEAWFEALDAQAGAKVAPHLRGSNKAISPTPRA
jgi:hypothetical protein